MTRRQRVQCDMFQRVLEFRGKHGGKFTKSSAGGKTFAALEAAVADIERFSTATVRTDDDGTGAKAAARAAMIEQLQEVARTARLAARAAPAGTAAAFKVPRWGNTDAALIAAVRAVIRDGHQVVAALTPFGVSGSFVHLLETLLEQFLEAESGRQAGRLDLAAARTGFANAVRRASDAVHTLDVIVANTFKKDAMLLAEWTRARRWTPPGTAVTDTPPTPTPQPAPPAPSPAPAPAPVVVDPSPTPDAILKKVS